MLFWQLKCEYLTLSDLQNVMKESKKVICQWSMWTDWFYIQVAYPFKKDWGRCIHVLKIIRIFLDGFDIYDHLYYISVSSNLYTEANIHTYV